MLLSDSGNVKLLPLLTVPSLIVTLPPCSCPLVSPWRRGRVLFINECQSRILLGSTFSGGLLSCSPLAIKSMLDIDGILAETRNPVSDKDRFLPDYPLRLPAWNSFALPAIFANVLHSEWPKGVWDSIGYEDEKMEKSVTPFFQSGSVYLPLALVHKHTNRATYIDSYQFGAVELSSTDNKASQCNNRTSQWQSHGVIGGLSHDPSVISVCLKYKIQPC